MALALLCCPQGICAQVPAASPCRVEAVTFDGWKAERLANAWVTLDIVPQLGGRLMQVAFGVHRYLFVNPQYEGRYFPPAQGAREGRWFNYGGDKIWPLPEGNRDEQHWPGAWSDVLDDGPYSVKASDHAQGCDIHLEGPPDPITGLQYSRDIHIGNSSPEISFHAVMKNVTGHPIQWSMQSVSQYKTSDPANPQSYNHDFWAFTPVNATSAYLDKYHVRSGPADDPSFALRDGLFTLHWLYLQDEVWLDSREGWIAVLDGSTKYAMVERFAYHAGADYPGLATVIFYSNGPSLQLNEQGMPQMTPADPGRAPYYMEAELNSPLITLKPGETYAMDTEWLPTRSEDDLMSVASPGVIDKPLSATAIGGKMTLSGTFGVFFPGRLVAYLYNRRGANVAMIPFEQVSPRDLLKIHREFPITPAVARVSLHLRSSGGVDLGSLGEAWVTGEGHGP
jgi:hypothetical protein